MGNYERGDLITLNDNSEYVVVDSFKLNDKNNLFLINNADKTTTILVELDNDEIIEINDEKEKNIVYKELIERNKEEINQYLKEINEN